jgi:hypothetical protein
VAAYNPDNIKSFFNLFTQITKENDIAKHNIHNMDEKGILMGFMNRELVLILKEKKTVFISQDKGREWVSSLEYICADGTTIDAFIIVKGVHFKINLFDHATSDTTIATSEKG